MSDADHEDAEQQDTGQDNGNTLDDVAAAGLYLKASAERRRRALQQWQRRHKPGPGGPPPPAPPGGPGTVNWTPVGPSVVAHSFASGNPPVSGRINAIAVGPGGMRIYAGADSGGVWFSSDGGASWVPLDDYAVSPSYTTGLDANALGLGSIAVHFGASAATDVIFVATGPGHGSIGIKYSANGGAPGTWSLEATNLAGLRIYRVLIDPDDPTRAYAATSGGLYGRPAAAPYTAWLHVTSNIFTNSSGSATDLI